MEDGKGEKFPSVVAVLGFTTLLVAFGGVDVWARLPMDRLFLMSRSTQPTDRRRKVRCVSLVKGLARAGQGDLYRTPYSVA